MKKYIPNIITLTRLIVAILFPILFFYVDKKLAVILYVAAASTDFIDGYLARKWEVVSELGKKLDVSADKLLAILGLTVIIIEINFLAIYLLILELSIVIIGFYFYFKNTPNRTTKIGKLKTLFLFPTICLIIMNKYVINIDLIIRILMAITMFLQIATAYSYIIQKGEAKK